MLIIERYFPIVILLLIFFGVNPSYAGWKSVKQFDTPVACGYFIDANNGVIGTGNNTNPGPLNIWWTADGGSTWNQAKTPGGSTGWVTSIFMVDNLVGYASLFSFDYSVWQTIDGGKTWTDFTQGSKFRATCIYKTSKAFIKTIWDGNNFNNTLGGNSLNGGNTYSQIFSGGVGWSNGIDFSDDNTGVVTLGPRVNNGSRTTSWFTQDGGVNWTKGGNLPESWSVYALKGSKIFLTLPEDDHSTPGKNVYWSQDGGNNWQIRFTFLGNREFTGHLGGYGNTIYTQTTTNINTGLFRSDNLGQSWKNVGGPSNTRDARFVVTGCAGEVVYAFDDQGAVWKTIDGGDGTLHPSGTNGATLSFIPDTLSISGICGQARGYISVLNPNCNSFIIDSLSFSPDPNKEFSLDTTKTGLNLFSNTTVGIPILFKNDSDVVRNTSVHVHAHSGSTVIDTIIIVHAQHTTIKGPIMALAVDSLYMEARYCQSLRQYIDLSNTNCNDLIIDSVILFPTYPELKIDTLQATKLLLPKFSSLGVPIFFQTDSNVTRHSTMRIIAHSLNRKIDTTIILVAKHSTAPEPYLIPLQKAPAGDTIVVPIYLKGTQDSFEIKHYSFHISYDGDILTPVKPGYRTIGTLSASGVVTTGASEPNGILCTVDFANPITEISDLTKPLIYLQMVVTLSRNMSTPVLLDSFTVSNIAAFSLCSIPQTKFIVDPKCGDSTLSSFLRSGSIVGLLSIRPNPNFGTDLEANIQLSQAAILDAELVDVSGRKAMNILTGTLFQIGKHILTINTSSLASGKYFLRIHTAEGYVLQSEIVIAR